MSQEWVVRRRWVARRVDQAVWARFRRRMRRSAGLSADGADAAGCAFELGEVALGLALILVLVVFVAPLLAAIVDVVVLLVIAGLGVVGRIVFRRPWTVEAQADDGTVLRWQVVGWRASGEFRARAAESLRAGVIPPGATTVDVPGGNLPN